MASNYPTVYYGSYGETVKQLQQALNQVGYSLDVDGGFGEKDPCGGAGLSAQEWPAGGRRGGQRDHGEPVGPAYPGYLRPQHQRSGALRRVG